jgi:nitronate monooxygenase
MSRIAGGRLAAAVASAGGLGTLGMLSPPDLRSAINRIRDEAPGRVVAVNLLMPFAHRRHVRTCIASGVDVVVLGFGGNAALVRELHDAGVFVLVMVGTRGQADAAVAWGVDALIAQGREAGGHLVGTVAAQDFLATAIAAARGRPVFLAGGIATGADTSAALAAGASGVVAGTRFLLTDESAAHPEYKRRLLAAEKTLETTVFGFGWPARHRVVPNAVTERWCRADGSTRRLPAVINSISKPVARLSPDNSEASILRLQRPTLPLLSPVAPLEGMPDTWIDRAALYAGDSVLRIPGIISAKQAISELAGP